jgi:hypothetical protein
MSEIVNNIAHEFRKYQKRESYHKKVISEQKAEIKKLKLDTQKLETVESEKRKANKSMAYFKKQNSEYREILMYEIVNNIA